MRFPFALLVSALAASVVPSVATAATSTPVTKGSHFEITAEIAPCEHGKECQLILTLNALEGFHINKEYPYKLRANEAAEVEWLGKDRAGKNVFSKAAGDFSESAPTVGKLKVSYRAKAAFTLKGNYKLSVCSDANCQLESVDISVAVPVK